MPRGRTPVVAIIGPGESASAADCARAESLGRLVACAGWILVNGGVASGVMDSASRGARNAGGTVIGILPGSTDADASANLSVAIVTGLGQARNNVIVLSSDAVVVCGMSAGTAVEASIATRLSRPLVFVSPSPDTRAFFESLGGTRTAFVAIPEDAIAALRPLLA